MKYISDDGKVFKTEEACLKHEHEVQDSQNKQDELLKKMEKVKEEIQEACTRYNKLLDEYAQLKGDPYYSIRMYILC